MLLSPLLSTIQQTEYLWLINKAKNYTNKDKEYQKQKKLKHTLVWTMILNIQRCNQN